MQNVAATKTVFGSMYRLFFQLFMFTKEFVILTIFFLAFFWSSKHSLFFQFLALFLAVKLKLHFFQKRLWCACVLGLGFRLFHFFWKVLFLFFGLLGAFLGPSFRGLQTKGQTLGWVCVPSSYFNMVIRQWDVEARKKGPEASCASL